MPRLFISINIEIITLIVKSLPPMRPLADLLLSPYLPSHKHHCTMSPNRIARHLIAIATIALSTAPIASLHADGTVYLVLGSDTAIWEGMDVARYNCTYTLTLFTDPSRNARAVMQPAFRSGLVDSYGTPMRLTWWMMAGNIFRYATNTNVPHANTMTLHLMKHHNGAAVQAFHDELTLHYHTFVWSDYNGDGTWYWNQAHSFAESAGDFDVTLAAMLLEEETFPVSFRSGWHAMDNEWQSHLNELIPFSLHNDWPAKRGQTEEPIDNVYDWSRAPATFVPFHPSPVDYQVPGSGKGWNVRSRYMSAADSTFMVKIFAEAATGKDQVVCLWAHLPEADFLDNIRKVHTSTVKAASRYPGTPFRYCTASEAMQRWMKTGDTTAPVITFEEIREGTGLRWRVTSAEPIFQSAPFVAAKTLYEEYRVLRMTPTGVLSWESQEPVDAADVVKAGVALTDTSGNQAMIVRRYLPDDIYTDDTDGGFSVISGTWSEATSSAWSATHHVTAPGTTGKVAVEWRNTVPSDGIYMVSVRLPKLAAPVHRTTFTLMQNGVTTDSLMCSAAPDAEVWTHLWTRSMTQGESITVRMSTTDTLSTNLQMGADVMRISALVRKRWFSAPTQLQAGDIIEGDSSKADLPLRNEGSLPLVVTGATSHFGLVSTPATFPRTIPPMGASVLPLSIRTTVLGRFEDTLWVCSDDPRHARVAIPVRGTGVPYFRTVDDLDSTGYRESGSWSTSVAQAFGARSRYAYPAAGLSASFSAEVRKAGLYRIEAIVPTTVNASLRARYVLSVQGVVIDTIYTDQNDGSGTWKTLFMREVPANAVLSILLTDAMSPPVSGKVLRADAVRFQWHAQATAVDQPTTIPQRIVLEQNYPNPFNPSTTLTYSVTAEMRVEIRIYDVLGRSVASPMTGLVEAGKHEVVWDATGLASGMYFARLVAFDRTGGTVLARETRMLLLAR